MTITLPESQLTKLADMIAERLTVRLDALRKQDERMLSCKEKAEQLGKSEATLRRWAREGKINAVKKGTTKQSPLLFYKD